MRIYKIAVVIVIILAIAMMPFLFLLQRDSAYYAYKEVIYRVIINNVVGKERDPKKVSLILLDYFHSNLFVPSRAKVIDKDVYNDLLRGIAWCDQRAWAMGTFLGKLGIDNRMIMTRNPEGRSNHTVLGVMIDRKLRFFDPYYGLYIKKNNEFVSYEDICRDPSMFYLSDDMLALKEIDPHKYDEVKNHFTKNIFYNNPYQPSIWSNPITKKDFKRRMITAISDSYICAFGNHFSFFYQDIYLAYFTPPGEGESVYFKARNYDLFGRYRKAVDSYNEVIDRFPQDPISEDSLFFLATLYTRNGSLEDSINTLQALLKKHPDTKWKKVAYYYLGLDYELLNNHGLAEHYYREAIEMYMASKEFGLRPTELKTAKRLSGIKKRVKATENIQ